MNLVLRSALDFLHVLEHNSSQIKRKFEVSSYILSNYNEIMLDTNNHRKVESTICMKAVLHGIK